MTPSKLFPFVSLILVNYNGLEHLRYSIPSLLTTNYPQSKMEIIFVDNDSQDASLSFVNSKYPQIKSFRHPNKGYGSGANYGVKQSQGEYLVILNIDLKYEPNWLQVLIHFMLKNPQVGICGPLLLPFSQINKKEKKEIREIPRLNFSPWGFPYTSMSTNLQPQPVFWIPGAVMLIKRKVWQELQGFDEFYFLYYEDLDLCYRAQILGYKIFLVPQSQVYHQESALINPLIPPPTKVFLTAQNNLYTILKNYSLPFLIRFLPLFLILRTADILYDLLHYHYWPFAKVKIKALLTIFSKIVTIKKQRQKIQKKRRQPDHSIFSVNAPYSLLQIAIRKIRTP